MTSLLNQCRAVIRQARHETNLLGECILVPGFIVVMVLLAMAYGPALSPSVEPVPVSPPDGASIAIAKGE